MEVIIAEYCGFCMGVNLAIHKAEETARETGKVLTDGPLIHNRQVVEKLRDSGIEEMPDGVLPEEGETVLLRAHGVPRQRREELLARGVRIVDATCPHVKKAQAIIERYTGEGFTGIVIGDKNHAEIRSILGHAKGPCHVVQNETETPTINVKDAPFVVICQTTFSIYEIDEILALLPLEEGRDIVVKTVCRATQDRQEAAHRIAEIVDVVFVVGGRHSANTNRLAKLCRSVNERTWHIETADEITPDKVEGARTAGVTAGASTPDWIIQKVCEKLESM